MLLKAYVNETEKSTKRYLLCLYKKVLELKKECVYNIENLENLIKDTEDDSILKKRITRLYDYKDLSSKCDYFLNNWNKKDILKNMSMVNDYGYLINEKFDESLEEGMITTGIKFENEEIGKRKIINARFIPIVLAGALGVVAGHCAENYLKQREMVSKGMELISNDINESGLVEYPTVIETSEGPKILFNNGVTCPFANGLEEYQSRYHNAGLSDEEGAIYLIDYGFDTKTVLSAFDTDSDKVKDTALCKYYENKYNEYKVKNENNLKLDLKK